MLINVANPIYDTVFKFLMEDERVARTILSALLKEKVLSVEIRRHEHTNTTRNNISMFRIDFAAKVLDEDNQEKLILIELQKTWLETETLRFRQYLGAQYLTPENVAKSGENEGFADPMVAIYLLGHRVGDVDEPVVYVKHNAYDYDGQEVKSAMNDPFIGSLTHNSIIVQIPLLHGQINNRLDKVLSVFDQTYRDKSNRQIITLDEEVYSDDADMMYLLRRLTAATVNADLRMDMNVEDEYFLAIENRDTELMLRDKRINEATIKLRNANNQLRETNSQLRDTKSQLQETESQLQETESQLQETESQLQEKEGQLYEKENQIHEKENQLKAMAQAMLNNGLSVDIIAQAMGRTVDEIQSLLQF